MRLWRWLESWPLWLLRSSIAVIGIVGGIMLTGLLVFSINPETSVQLQFDNDSAHDVRLRYDYGATTVSAGDGWKLKSEDAGHHVLVIAADRAPVGFRLNFTSATWNAKSFSMQFEIAESN
jgi:hypothetical protein